MNVEETARDYVNKMADPEKIKAYLTPDAMVSGSVLPQPIPGTQALGILGAWTTAMPDIKFDIREVKVNGNDATVQLNWGGTQSGPLSLPFPGMPTIPATGKKVWVKDTYTLTVKDGKVSYMRLDAAADGGMPGALAQLGVNMPGM